VPSPFQHCQSKGAAAKERICRNNIAFEVQHPEHLQRSLGFVAARCLARSQSDTSLGGKGVDHVKRCGALAPFVSMTGRFPIDRDAACELQLVVTGETFQESAKSPFEGLRVQQTKNPADRIVAGNPILQRQEQPQDPLLGTSKPRHVRSPFAPHSTALKAMTRISSNSCCAFSARGSCNFPKIFLNLTIRLPSLVGSRLQNPVRQTAQ